MAVYCSAWTYFGSVGRASAAGVWFLPCLLGPMLAMILRLDGAAQVDPHRARAAHHLDRGLHLQPLRQEPLLAGLVTLITVIGILPYIALQLKASPAPMRW